MGQRTFHRIPGLVSGGLELYSRLDGSCFGPPLRESDHYLIRKLAPPDGIEIVLAMAHLPSPSYKDHRARHSRVVGFAADIRDVESSGGNDRTVVVGDLNVNPFDDALLDVRGLNAVADRATVERRNPRQFERRRKETFRMFYNPMWNHFGDAVQPPGTYYYDRSNPEVDPLWNMFDQVLLRRSLLNRFRPEDLKILTDDGTVSFLRKGHPNGAVYSDHLPICSQLDLRRHSHAGG